VLRVALSFLVIFLAQSLPAQNAKTAVHSLEHRYHSARTLKAEFFERFSDGNGAFAAESGSVYFSRPGRMRWEYESPEQKLFLVDGKNVWLYVPADRTASRARLKESSDWRTPLALLTGNADLARLCRAVELVNPETGARGNSKDRPEAPENTLLRCVPRSKSDEAGNVLREVLLETDPEAHLVRVVLREAGNLETEFRFAAWQENIAIPESKFHFQPPSGVAIVDEESLASGIR
jgi:outer membrane lipoprotein carrier protein